MIQPRRGPAAVIEGQFRDPPSPDVDKLDDMRMAADRILLATIQTSLSLIGFGFTLYQIFSEAAEKAGLARRSPVGTRLGLTLLGLGLILLAAGLWGHLLYKRDLDARRARLVAEGVVNNRQGYHTLPIFMVGLVLLLVSVATTVQIVLRMVG